MHVSPTVPASRAARRLLLRGHVQGLGVRPAIYRLAEEMGLTGYVQNTAGGVEILAEGPDELLAEFAAMLPDALPAGTILEKLIDEPARPGGRDNFVIVRQPAEGPLTARVPPDLAVCGDCLRETFDPGDRRFRYPLTSCTQCGPRYSIIRSMPYERPDTTMAPFPFCPACEAEYTLPSTRRFHAQTNACGQCGPQVWAVDAGGRRRGDREDALRFALRTLHAGKILALKGVGGYQLLVDAASAEAVRRLRRRKHRPAKPLAVMVQSLAAAEELAHIDPAERDALCGPANPIVVLSAQSDTTLCEEIHPHLNCVGLMLPSTPLHALLAADFGKPLVCTSGNDDGEPLVYREADAPVSLAGVCDAWLHHNRPIERPIDDSVVRVIAGRPVTIRLARGLAPLPLDLPADESILALGGHMKSAAAWSNGRQAVLGQHVGELESLATRQRLLEQLAAWQELYRFRPGRLVHDLHPDYYTTKWAQDHHLPSLAVQHHHAHVVAGMLPHGWLDRTVLGVSWDGTGYGPDGSVWGGEFLIATVGGYRRVARLRPFPLPGGETCIRQPWRAALSVVAAAVGREEATKIFAAFNATAKLNVLLNLLDTERLSPRTSSAGRLFDAAAHLILGIDRAEYEGQAATMLEAAADPVEGGQYELPLTNDQGRRIAELDWRPLIGNLLADRRRGVAPRVMAMRFHRALATGIVKVCRRRPDLPIVLGGGVFQNRLLTELVVRQLEDHSQPLGTPGVIPPGDGGLAAGQLAATIAMNEDNH